MQDHDQYDDIEAGKTPLAETSAAPAKKKGKKKGKKGRKGKKKKSKKKSTTPDSYQPAQPVNVVADKEEIGADFN